MNETLLKPYDWVKQISSSVFELDDKPLFGKGPSFPWEAFSLALAKLLEQKDISIRPADMQWRVNDQLEGLGGDLAFTNIEFSGLEGILTWVISKKEFEPLMQKLFSIPVTPFAALDAHFEEGFYRFALSQVLQIIKQLDFDKNLSPSLAENQEFNKEPAFCIDIDISVQQQTFKGRLIIPKDLQTSWKERYAERKLGSHFNTSLAQKATVIIHLEAGKTVLSPSELAEVTLGDYIILDSCSYEPDADKGRVMMTINGIPLFRAKLKQGNLKILEFPLYHEEKQFMINKDHDEDFEDHTEESELEEFTDEDFLEEETEEEHSEISSIDTEKEKLPSEKLPAPPPPPSPGSSTQQESATMGRISIPDLPVNVVIEVGRIQMSVQKLMELSPGNMLEIDITPENGVDLVVNGKRIGKGELIRIGDTLGVRVLDLG